MLAMELQELLFFLLSFHLSLVQLFLDIPSFLPFGRGMFTMWYHMWELCDIVILFLLYCCVYESVHMDIHPGHGI